MGKAARGGEESLGPFAASWRHACKTKHRAEQSQKGETRE
jgi:hypothetical protein